MSPKTNNARSVGATGTELAELAAKVSKWGMEAGLLGIEGHLEGRVLALVREASIRVFGNCEAERDSVVCRIEAMEREREESERRIREVRSARESMRSSRGLLGWFLSWFVGPSETRRAQVVRRRTGSELRKARLDLETAEHTRRDAAEWREMAVQYLRATYEYHKARAVTVRPEGNRFEKEKEQTHDARNNRQFVIHRAN